MNRHPALSLDLDDGIDRKVLGQLRQRFLAVNAGRLQRARQALSSRQERVLRLLPLLFHINHPLLPGYLSASTPAGLAVSKRTTKYSPKPSAWPARLSTSHAGKNPHSSRSTACS